MNDRPDDPAGNGGNTGGGGNVPGNTPGNTNANEFNRIHTLGHVGWLIARDPAYRHLFVSDLEWLVMPPVALDQVRIWRKDNMPVIYASWAFVGEVQAERLRAGIRRLPPTEWRSGGEPWLIDLVAPFGGREEALAELKAEVFDGQDFNIFEAAATQL